MVPDSLIRPGAKVPGKEALRNRRAETAFLDRPMGRKSVNLRRKERQWEPLHRERKAEPLRRESMAGNPLVHLGLQSEHHWPQ